MAEDEKDTRMKDPEVQASLGALVLQDEKKTVEVKPTTLAQFLKPVQDAKTVQSVVNSKRRAKYKREGKHKPRPRRGPQHWFDPYIDFNFNRERYESKRIKKQKGKQKGGKDGSDMFDPIRVACVGSAAALIGFFLLSK